MQCQIWGRGTGIAGGWKALKQGTQGRKTEKSVAPYLLRVLAWFLFSELRPKYMNSTNLNGVNRWPGWFLAYFSPPDIAGKADYIRKRKCNLQREVCDGRS